MSHMSLFDPGYRTLNDIVYRVAQDLAHSNGIPVVLNGNILHEAFTQAERHLPSSATFYHEGGYICFWINKTKPARVGNPDINTSNLGRILRGVPNTLLGHRASIEYPMAHRIANTFALNEAIALKTAMEIIHAAQYLHSENFSSGNLSDYEDQMKDRVDIVNKHMFDKIIISLRYDTYSMNSMSLLLESLLRTKHG